ncbi:UDP-N-acetylmuramoyl-tripeptide--D-alanyl-D-alanine ligase [Actinomyces sp. zg296]|uniref:UDP-N-acetylmuramoyl-tripeptide--D-alanyl-D- alanine ligase n=1 Tax=Actinomyces sp. zg296 TaxID=2609289 RepID=UPI001356B63A|nr:UDP-N-acetylmuramoyl-tripeptide--D-alanyl-D-alanine ligase [Actinomyces sp. zg296]
MGCRVIARAIDELSSWAQGRLIPPAPPAAPVTRVVTDSRRAGPGSLFVAIKGERADGHDYLAAVARAGAAAALVSDETAARAALAEAGRADGPGAAMALIVVEDTVAALGRIARGHLADLRQRAGDRGLAVVAMTGSVGKTTTKDLTRQLLAAQGPTIAPVASFNNEIGLPLTVLEADESTRYLVLEMGASGPDDIADLVGIAPLDAAAVLMIGHAHMGGFGSIEGVATAKSHIVRGLLPHGTAILNLDDERAAAMGALAPAGVLTFSASGDERADLRATAVELDEAAHAVAEIHLPGAAPRRVRLGLPGAHNVANALAALGLALAAGAGADDLLDAIASAGLESPHRMAVSDLPGGGRLIDDSYNANIDSMTASLASLPALAGDRRRVVVISEMLELGESSAVDHATVGALAADAGASLLVAIGAGAAPAAEAARQRGVEVVETPDADGAIARIPSLLAPGDAILVKGSHGSGAWRVADHLAAGGPTAAGHEATDGRDGKDAR